MKMKGRKKLRRKEGEEKKGRGKRGNLMDIQKEKKKECKGTRRLVTKAGWNKMK